MIEKKGFLSPDIGKVKAKHRADNNRLFGLAESLNEFAHGVMLDLKVSNADPAEVFSACAYIKVLGSFQSVVILVEMGLINDAKTILRSLVESMFAMVAIARDKDFALKLIEQEILDRRRSGQAINNCLERGDAEFGGLTLDDAKKQLQKLKAEIKSKGIKPMYKSTLAAAAGLESFYDTIYHVLCGSIHINSKDLEQYLHLGEDGAIKEITWWPDVDEIENILFAAIESMVMVLQSLHHLFGLDFPKDWEPLYQEYIEVGKVAVEEIKAGVITPASD